MSKQNFYVIGYPKSGTTWVSQLIGDVLNSPVGGSIPRHDDIEPASEGQDRTGEYFVRKGHYKLLMNKPTTIKEHELYRHDPNPKIMIVRDPRDIAVSAHYYHHKSVKLIVDRMIGGKSYNLGRWDRYCGEWKKYALPVRYEDLLQNTKFAIEYLLYQLDVGYDHDRLLSAIKRQSFDVRKRSDSFNILRKAQPGNWKDYRETYRLKDHFGGVMEMFGYAI